jgi:hypothetical protein
MTAGPHGADPNTKEFIMPRWIAADALAMSRPQEVQVATRARDGSLRRPRTIWIVSDGTAVYIRSTNGRGADWFKAAIGGGSGQITAQGRTWDVVFQEASDEGALSTVDAAYRTKYRQYASIVDHLASPGPRVATLRVDPATRD